MRIPLPVLSVLFLLSGCAIIDNNPLPDSADAYLFNTCGPADGLALDIFIPVEPGNSCQNIEDISFRQPFKQNLTRIYITSFPAAYEDESLTPFYFGREFDPDSGNGSGGWAGFCEEGGTTCIDAARGTIQLPPPPLSGTFDTRVQIQFSNGTQLNRNLEVRACQRSQPILCG